jgi:acetyl esterase
MLLEAQSVAEFHFGRNPSIAVGASGPALDPEAVSVIGDLSGAANLATLTAKAARSAYSAARRPLAWPLEEVAAVEDYGRLGPGTPPLRLFRPKLGTGRAKLTLIFLHGGGWTVGGLDVYEPLCRRLANALRANLIWVSYGLAPENPFPGPIQETLAACRSIFHHADKLGLDPTRVGIIGDSAGGNLAAVAALMNRYGQLGHRFVSQVLIYPCLDLTASLPSHRQFETGYLLTADIYAWYRKNYLQGVNPTDWHLSPLFAKDVSGLPPSVVLHAGFDPLRDEALAYLDRLRSAGVPVREISFPGMIHGFLNMGRVMPQAGQAVELLSQALTGVLAEARPVHRRAS